VESALKRRIATADTLVLKVDFSRLCEKAFVDDEVLLAVAPPNHCFPVAHWDGYAMWKRNFKFKMRIPVREQLGGVVLFCSLLAL
jgi:hypothetical protein